MRAQLAPLAAEAEVDIPDEARIYGNKVLMHRMSHDAEGQLRLPVG